MQRGYVNHAMHDLHSLNKIFISIFETEYEIYSTIYETIHHSYTFIPDIFLLVDGSTLYY